MFSGGGCVRRPPPQPSWRLLVVVVVWSSVPFLPTCLRFPASLEVAPHHSPTVVVVVVSGFRFGFSGGLFNYVIGHNCLEAVPLYCYLVTNIMLEVQDIFWQHTFWIALQITTWLLL